MKYTAAGDLGELAKPENRGKAVACLNEMITDALECVPECMEYMAMLKTEEVFRFCAIPQVQYLLYCTVLSCPLLSRTL
jgi:farnesyl-diphosphate farnesyltransferase